jgi:hypothetical protein
VPAPATSTPSQCGELTWALGTGLRASRYDEPLTGLEYPLTDLGLQIGH